MTPDSQCPKWPLVQIAGIRDLAEAELCIAAGVEWLGFPLRLPVHEPDLSEAAAAALISQLPASVVPVLITYLSQAGEIASFCDDLGVRHVQLHGDIDVQQLQSLRRERNDLFVIKSLVVHSGNEQDLQERVMEVAPLVDAFITDTYDPDTGASGATGKTHDWAVSRRLVAASPKPVILAGGLTPANVGEAIEIVRPAGVDAHTGVEDSQGAKDRGLVEGFAVAARRAWGGR